MAPDRPFSAWVYMLVTPLLGEAPWAYHLLLMLLRWGAAVQVLAAAQAAARRRLAAYCLCRRDPDVDLPRL